MIKTFYELNELTSFDSAVEAFRVYLLREKSISTVNIKRCQNFVGLVKKLNRRKQMPDRKTLAPFKDDLLQTKDTAEFPWLQVKANELS